MSSDLSNRLRAWARDTRIGRNIFGADQDLLAAADAIEAYEAALRELVSVSSRLAVAAQTTGGVAGRDEGLCAEIDRLAQPLEEARIALEKHNG